MQIKNQFIYDDTDTHLQTYQNPLFDRLRTNSAKDY